nr:unnamed protein product [Digitaria exilis]
MAGQSGDLKLLSSFASPFSLRVKLALSFKGLSYENLEQKELHTNKSELLLKSNPVHKKVPVLIHDGKPLFSSWMMVFKGKTDEEKAEGTKQSFAVAATLEGQLRECSKGKPFFGGDSVGYVDVALGGFVAWVHAIEKLYGLKLFDAANTPLLAAWLDRFCALDAAKAVMPEVDKLVELAKMRQAQAAAAAEAQGN